MASILLNHVYYSPVGHVVEAIRYARGLRDANPGSEVHVALSDGAPWELCAGAPWITAVYRIPVADPGSCDLSVPEMLVGAAFLLDPATTYKDALAQHRANIAWARIRHDRMPESVLDNLTNGTIVAKVAGGQER
jgi:hypothetical protein